MKWTYNYVWEKVESVIPTAREFGFVLPQALEKAAVKLFLEGEGPDTGSYRAYVISEGIKELKTKGFLEFGDVEKDWQ